VSASGRGQPLGWPLVFVKLHELGVSSLILVELNFDFR
jgi:hypothetical protein